MRNKIVSVLVTAFSSVMLSACGGSAGTDTQNNSRTYQPKPKIITSNSVVGGVWYLSSINGSSYQGKRLFLNLNDTNKVNGFSGCNRFSTSILQLTDSQLKFSPIRSTRMGCPSNAILERDFMNALADIYSYSRNRDRLILMGSKFELVFFKKSTRR